MRLYLVWEPIHEPLPRCHGASGCAKSLSFSPAKFEQGVVHQLSIQFWRLGCLGFGVLGFRLVASEGSGQRSSASTELNTNIGSPGVRDRERERERDMRLKQSEHHSQGLTLHPEPLLTLNPSNSKTKP